MKKLALLLVCFALAGCSGGQNDDLKQFVANAGKGLQGKVKPLPQVKPYKPFTYDAFTLSNPFQPRKMKTGGRGAHPDFNRPKELLENYALENLKMVGTLELGKTYYAIVKTPDNLLHRIKAGNYLGQHFGKIVKITETKVIIQETVEDANGDWVKKENSLQLQE